MAHFVPNSSAANQKMYCHNCSREFIKIPDALFECPTCNQGFVEDVIDDTPPNQDLDNRLETFVSRLNRQQELMRSYMTRHLNASDSITAIAARVDEILRPRAMTEAQLQEIPKATITEEHIQIQCAVCFDNFALGEIEVCQLQCNHLFHEKCIFPWAQSTGTCPVCRAVLPNVNRDDDTTFNMIDQYITQMENIISNLIGATPLDSSRFRVEREIIQNNCDGQVPDIQDPSSAPNTTHVLIQEATTLQPLEEESSLDYPSDHSQVIPNSSADDSLVRNSGAGPLSEAVDDRSSVYTATEEFKASPNTRNERTSDNRVQRKRNLDKEDLTLNSYTSDDDDDKEPPARRQRINDTNRTCN